MTTVEYLSKTRLDKHISISETTIKFVKQYAAMQGMTFSRAIEALALMSIRETRVMGVTSVMESVVTQAITRQYNRFAKLLVHTALEAGAARQVGESLYWLKMLEFADEYQHELKRGDPPTLSGLEKQFSINPQSPMGEVLLTLLKKRRSSFRARSVGSLKRPIEEFAELYELFEGWVAERQAEDEAA